MKFREVLTECAREEDTRPFRRESIDQIIHDLIEHDAAECAEKFRHSTTPPPPAAD